MIAVTVRNVAGFSNSDHSVAPASSSARTMTQENTRQMTVQTAVAMAAYLNGAVEGFCSSA